MCQMKNPMSRRPAKSERKGVPPYLEHSTPMAISASMVPIAWWLMIGTPKVLPVVTTLVALVSYHGSGSKKRSEGEGNVRS